jgi:hypothetical protein
LILSSLTPWQVFNSPLKSLLVSIIRFFAAKAMIGGAFGTLDEFRVYGKLICWSSTVVKGDTMRAMWFYQHQTAREQKMNLWYLALVLSLCRVGNMEGVTYLDSGPSYNEDSKVAKEVRMEERREAAVAAEL